MEITGVTRKRVREEDIIVISSDEDGRPNANRRARRSRPRNEARQHVVEIEPPTHQDAAPPQPALPLSGLEGDLLPIDHGFFIIDEHPVDFKPMFPKVPQFDRASQALDTHSNGLIQPQMAPAKSAVDICVDTCIELFPGISHDRVRQLFIEHQGDTQQVTNAILESSNYPKQKEGSPIKAMTAPLREDYTRSDRPAPSRTLYKAVFEVLRAEFPETPGTYIKSVLDMKKQLYPAYLALKEAMRLPKRPYPRRRKRDTVDASWIITELGEPAQAIQDELTAAKDACLKQDAERENLEKCKQEGKIHECSVCFDECPHNRSVGCNADTSHYTCYDCTKAYIGSEIGQGTCNVTCPFGIDGKPCGAAFSEAALKAIDEPKLLKRLFTLKQQQEIREAGLGDLAECPFCDYKAIYPPIEENFVFQCQNPDCMLLSCRRCNMESHVPRSCKENSKDDALQKRHRIEEAMTKALVRTCNKCKTKFVKELGCNKMTCKCRNTQCYVCGKSVGYEHFSQGGMQDSKKCPLYDDLEERHKKDVEKAEKEAREAVQKEFPEVASEDLEIRMADAVKNRPVGPADQGARAMLGGLLHVHEGHYDEALAQLWQEQQLGDPVARIARLRQQQEELEDRLERLGRIRQQHRVAQEQRRAARRQQRLDAVMLGGMAHEFEAPVRAHQGEIQRSRQQDRDRMFHDPPRPLRFPEVVGPDNLEPIDNEVPFQPYMMPHMQNPFANHLPNVAYDAGEFMLPAPAGPGLAQAAILNPQHREQQQQAGANRRDDQRTDLNLQRFQERNQLQTGRSLAAPMQAVHFEAEDLRQRLTAIAGPLASDRDAPIQMTRQAYAAWNARPMVQYDAQIPPRHPIPVQGTQAPQR